MPLMYAKYVKKGEKTTMITLTSGEDNPIIIRFFMTNNAALKMCDKIIEEIYEEATS